MEAAFGEGCQHPLSFLRVGHVGEGQIAFSGDGEVVHLVGVGRGLFVDRLGTGDFLKRLYKGFSFFQVVGNFHGWFLL